MKLVNDPKTGKIKVAGAKAKASSPAQTEVAEYRYGKPIHSGFSGKPVRYPDTLVFKGGRKMAVPDNPDRMDRLRDVHPEIKEKSGPNGKAVKIARGYPSEGFFATPQTGLAFAKKNKKDVENAVLRIGGHFIEKKK